MRQARSAVAIAALALLALSGCTSNPVAPPVKRTVAPVAPATTPAPSPTTPPPTQTAADATPLHRRCGRLAPRAAVAAFLPELALEKGWTPATGAPAARLAALDGTACRWSDAAGDLLEIAVAKPSAKDATALKNDLVERSQSVPTYGGEAYFQVAEHVGQADVFRGRVWVEVRSNRFFEPGDATALVTSALRALGLAPKPTATPTGTPTTPGAAPTTPAPTPAATP